MSIPQKPEPAALIISLLTATFPIKEIVIQLEQTFGGIEEICGPLDFSFTSYYDSELGSGIKRYLIFFRILVDRERLAEIKCLTNTLEQQYSDNGKRAFNLDPGLLTLGNFVLATGKNNAHRIYLKDGIFADLTLIFRAKTFRPLEWTYPDYSDSVLIQELNRLRESYKCKLTASTPICEPKSKA